MDCYTPIDIDGCTYSPSGVQSIELYPLKDFQGYRLVEGEVTEIYAEGSTEIPTNVSSKYGLTNSTGIATHKITTFLHNMSKDLINAIEGLKSIKTVVIFSTLSGNKFLIGAGTGATLTYTGTTEDNNGFEITLTADSEAMLLPVARNCKEKPEPVTVEPYYMEGSENCHEIDGNLTGVQYATAMLEVGLFSRKETGRYYKREDAEPFRFKTLIAEFAKGELVLGIPSTRINTLACTAGAIPAVIKEVETSYFK